MRTGDVLICRVSSIISKAIMTVTRSKWSRVAIVGSAWGKVCVIEAQRNGVNLKTWETWVNKWNYTYEVWRPPYEVDEREFMLRVMALVGETKYDYFTFFRRAFGNRKNRSEEKENKKFICSELVLHLTRLGYDPDIIPDELLEVLIKNNYQKIEL